MPLALYTPLGALWHYKEKEPFGVKNERIRAWIKKQLSERRISSAGASVLEIGHLRAHDQLRRYVRKTLPQSQMPTTLMIHAKEDEVASLHNVKWLHEHWQGSKLSYVELANSYHMITIDNERETVNQETSRFLKKTVNSQQEKPVFEIAPMKSAQIRRLLRKIQAQLFPQ